VDVKKLRNTVLDTAKAEISLRNSKQLHHPNIRSEVLTAVKMPTVVLWLVAPCRLAGRHQHFRGTYCLHLQMEAVYFPKTLVPTYNFKRLYIPENQQTSFLYYITAHD
jgi:hypothetical protein